MRRVLYSVKFLDEHTGISPDFESTPSNEGMEEKLQNLITINFA